MSKAIDTAAISAAAASLALDGKWSRAEVSGPQTGGSRLHLSCGFCVFKRGWGREKGSSFAPGGPRSEGVGWEGGGQRGGRDPPIPCVAGSGRSSTCDLGQPPSSLSPRWYNNGVPSNRYYRQPARCTNLGSLTGAQSTRGILRRFETVPTVRT